METKRLNEFSVHVMGGEGHIPSVLESGVLYVSLHFGCIRYLCPCGCGKQSGISIRLLTGVADDKGIGTPLLWDTGWNVALTENKTKITVSPSILDKLCKAHYFIENNKVRWCPS